MRKMRLMRKLEVVQRKCKSKRNTKLKIKGTKTDFEKLTYGAKRADATEAAKWLMKTVVKLTTRNGTTARKRGTPVVTE